MSLAHPWCSDSVKAVSREETVAAIKREEKIGAKYNSKLLPEGCCLLVIPLVFKHFGCWGKQAVRYLNKLAKSGRDDEGNGETDFKNNWRSIISVALQRCNVKVVSDKVISIARLERRNVVCSGYFCMLQDRNGVVC